MKHLLTGVAMAAALAIAAPAWAQNAPSAPMTPPAAAPGKPMAAPAKPMAPKPMAAKPMAKKPMHHHMVMHKMNSGDAATEELNRQELARITGGGATSAPMPSTMPGGNNPTSGTAGPFAPSK